MFNRIEMDVSEIKIKNYMKDSKHEKNVESLKPFHHSDKKRRHRPF